MLIKPFKATDQSNPGLLQQVVELFRPALLLATGRAVGQAQVLESLLIASCNAGRQSTPGLLVQVTLRNQGISATDPTVQPSAPKSVGTLVPQSGTFVPDHGCNGFGWMDWQPEALAALKKDVPFFVRPAVRKRVEAMADSDGRSDIDLDFYKSAKQAMAPS